MKNKSIFLWLASGAIIGAITTLGVKNLHRKTVFWRYFKAIREKDVLKSVRALSKLRKFYREDCVQIALETLNHRDEKLQGEAATSLMQLRVDESHAPALIPHLGNNSSPRVRLVCSAALMNVETPEVTRAYIAALNDSYERVVQIACVQLGYRGGEEATTALFALLENTSWKLRLSACQALIELKAADEKVVSVLEAMSGEPEAAEHDKVMDEIDEITEKVRDEGTDLSELEMLPNKMADILVRAQKIARENFLGLE